MTVLSQRLELQELLESFTPHVYFQPPENFRMSFPCIRYRRDTTDSQHADNLPYALHRKYEVTIIDPDPEGLIASKLETVPTSRHMRTYVADGLNHDVYQLTF